MILRKQTLHRFIADSEPVDKDVTKYQQAVVDATQSAFQTAHTSQGSFPTGLVGMVLATKLGEKYPELWREVRRVRPKQFGLAVNNSAAGHASIVYKIGGPMVTVVNGDPEEVADLLIKGGLATYVICAEDKDYYIEGWLVDEPSR